MMSIRNAKWIAENPKGQNLKYLIQAKERINLEISSLEVLVSTLDEEIKQEKSK